MNDFAASATAGADVQSALAGDEVAFARLVTAHHADMVRISFVITGQDSLAQDAVQSAWLVAWRKLRGLRDPSRVRPWLLTIAANEARQISRSRRRHTVVEIQPEIEGGHRDDPAEQIARVDLVRALNGLSADDRALIALRYIAGFEPTELARILGRSASGTRGRLSRLMTRLRGELSDA